MVAALVYVFWSSADQPRRASVQRVASDPAQSPCEHGANCVHKHEAYKDSSTHSEVTLKEPVALGERSIYESKAGDRFELDFGEGLVFEARVKVNKTFPGNHRSVNMQILGRQGWVYWLEKVDGSIMGNIKLKDGDENIIYRFSGRDGDLVMRQISQQQFVCSGGNKDEDIGMPASDDVPDPAGQQGIIPLLNSLPGAVAVVYIDFDGEEVSGTRWVNGGTINAEPAGFTENRIREVWEEVAEDMRPFKINVTTDRAVFDAAPQNKKMMCIVTPTNDAAPSAGGVAYLNSFYDGSIDPCWCFNLSPGSAAMTVSHEVGHTFGLRHDGLTSQNDPEYHQGNGTWGPIMGAPFGLNVVTWSIGDYQGSTNTEDDLAIIDSRSARFREDLYGDSPEEAFDLAGESGQEFGGLLGVIETPEDIDVFKIKTSGGSINLRAASSVDQTNMNIRMALYDDNGRLLVENDPQSSYNAAIATKVDPGNYTLHVEGTGDGSPDESGFTDYGSIGEYALTGDIDGLGGLIVKIEQPKPENVSIISGNGLVLEASVQGEEDSVGWTAVRTPPNGVVTFSSTSSKSSRATFSAPGLYTLRFRASLSPISTDAELNVSVESRGQAKRYPNQGPKVSIEPADLYFSDQGSIIGTVSDDGVPIAADPGYEWKVVSGTVQIANPSVPRPVLLFSDNKPSVVALESSDGEIRTFAQAKIQSFYEERLILSPQASGRWFIPQNDDLGTDWTAVGFDDFGWNQGLTGFGYDEDGRYGSFIGAGADLEPAMKGKSPSAYLRIPFSLPQLDYVQGLKLLVNFNDAIVVYLNGVEVARRNAPEGALNWDSRALNARSDKASLAAEEINLFGDLGALNTGENVLAIHGLNNASEDPNFLVNPVIEAELIASPFFGFLERYGLQNDPAQLPEVDTDADDSINLVEHALGTDPTEGNGDLYPLRAGKATNGTLKITLPLDAPDDVDYRVERAIGGVENWEVVASKRGSSDWAGDSIFVYVEKIVNGSVTYAIRELNLTSAEAASPRLYRLGYALRGPGLSP
ncbi:MAG: zinc-dependent metalloprotease family protein [Akkermansiaceae bacterium]